MLLHLLLLFFSLVCFLQNKIYILGGRGVGKTSFLRAIFSEQFDEKIQPSEKGIAKLNINEVNKANLVDDSNNRELEENINTLVEQLELIQLLMDQISLNFDLANKNKELLLTNIELSNQLNQQIINNTALLNENQNLISEKVELNNKLNTQTDINKILKNKIQQL